MRDRKSWLAFFSFGLVALALSLVLSIALIEMGVEMNPYLLWFSLWALLSMTMVVKIGRS